MASQLKSPAAVTTQYALNGIACGGAQWASLENALIADGSSAYAAASSTGTYGTGCWWLAYSQFSFSIPTNATINTYTCEALVRASHAELVDSANYHMAALAQILMTLGTQTQVNYSNYIDQWHLPIYPAALDWRSVCGTNLATSALTPAIVNDPAFSVGVGVFIFSSDATPVTIWLDAMRLTLNYTDFQGYRHAVTGVPGANIASINGVPAVNLAKFNGV